MGFVFALTLPGLVVLLVVLAGVDQLMLRMTGRGLVPWRSDRQVSATGFELLHGSLSPGKQHELDQRTTVELVRDDEEDGAPPGNRVDLASGVARVTVPRRMRG